MTRKNRENGVLLPISSLPGRYGIGSLGKAAFDFVDYLSEAGVEIWQMLPLNVTSYGDSPYQSPSNNGLNYYFLDLDILVKKGLLTKEEAESVDYSSQGRKINYGLLFNTRIPLLKKAFQRFDRKNQEFEEFVKKGTYSDFAFFMTMKELHHYTSWYQWPEEDRIYTPFLERKTIEEHHDLYLFYLWTQYEFLEEYHALKKYANDKGIRIMGDMPLYLARDSVEVYKYPEMFLLDENHNPTMVAGCPPDYFNADGQLWGNPIYDWEFMKSTGYQWWNKRIEGNLALFDILRIDHFRGIAAYYTIPYGSPTAREGKWVEGPGMALFRGKEDYPIIAEDLGFMDDMVRELLRESGYPGMKVLEFAFDGHYDNEHKGSQAKYNFVCYTGTHDNEPLAGYIENLDDYNRDIFLKDVQKECRLFAVDYDDSSLKSLVRTVDQLAYASPCRISILPMADILAFGEEARLNTPALMSDKNWSFRYLSSDFDSDSHRFLKESIRKFGR